MAAHDQCYCAFCRAPRKLPPSNKLNFKHFFLNLLLSHLIMLIVWKEWNPKVFLILVGFSGLTQFILQLRWRIMISCKWCGFDPLLYLNKREDAAQKVRKYLNKNSLQLWLSPIPKKIQSRIAETRRAKSSSELVSQNPSNSQNIPATYDRSS